MNTEFPNRLPIIQTTENLINRAASNNTASTTQPTEFEKNLLNIFQKSVKTLNSITDFVADLNTNEKLADEVRKTRKDNKKRTKESNEHRFSFYKKITTGLSLLSNYWKDSVGSITSTIENANSSISSAIGGVFGSGVIGRTISNILNKSLSFFTSKILMDRVVSKLSKRETKKVEKVSPSILPAILKIGLIGTAIGFLIRLIVKNWDRIFPILEWIWNAIDQGFDWITSIFGKSKYESARKGLSEEFGVDEGVIKKYYGDTISGRAKMLEDWNKIQDNDKYADSIRPLIKEVRDQRNNDINALFSGIRGMPQLGTGPSSIINNQTIINRNSPDESSMSMERAFTEGGITSNRSPVITNVNNVSTVQNAISGLTANNTSTSYPMSSIDNSWVGGFSPIR